MEIHCHICGGFINDPGVIAYRLPVDAPSGVVPVSALCTCRTPTVYGPPPGHASSPGMPAIPHGAM
ncbi:MAG TPA: hypothetical protein VH116_01470 [Gemmatimonadales bacterium]|nr:hypothetical protein [Gemmatimonadales bacterium]